MFDSSPTPFWSFHFSVTKVLPWLGIAGGLLGCSLCLLYLYSGTPEVSTTDQVSITQLPQGKVVVYVSGAVQKPGLYELTAESRIADALELAGGLLDSADREYIASQLAMAKHVNDESSIYIPFKTKQSSVASSDSKVKTLSINTASKNELINLPKIGEKTAQAIIDARPYISVEGLVEKKLISRDAFESIRSEISL